jgi:hypothetical protein
VVATEGMQNCGMWKTRRREKRVRNVLLKRLLGGAGGWVFVVQGNKTSLECRRVMQLKSDLAGCGYPDPATQLEETD